MFILVQFPFADLRPLIPGQLGRLTKPDWTADLPDASFVRGFGKISTRNSRAFGLLGERAFADFNQAARLKDTLFYSQKGWDRRLQVELRFRRLYFDGRSAGRFEYGFIIYDSDEDAVRDEASGLIWRPGQLAAEIQELKLVVQSGDGRRVDTTVGRCGRALGMAYVVATTQASELESNPPADVYGRAVAVGIPLIHLRVSGGRKVNMGHDARPAVPGNDRFFITSAIRAQIRNNVLVQLSSGETLKERPEERALRVVISHLNSICFASDFLSTTGLGLGVGRPLAEEIKAMLDSFKRFEPTGPADETDQDFTSAIRTFASAFDGRIEEVAKKLQALRAKVEKPAALRVLGKATGERIWSLLQLVTKTAVENSLSSAKGS